MVIRLSGFYAVMFAGVSAAIVGLSAAQADPLPIEAGNFPTPIAYTPNSNSCGNNAQIIGNLIDDPGFYIRLKSNFGGNAKALGNYLITNLSSSCGPNMDEILDGLIEGCLNEPRDPRQDDCSTLQGDIDLLNRKINNLNNHINSLYADLRSCLRNPPPGGCEHIRGKITDAKGQLRELKDQLAELIERQRKCSKSMTGAGKNLQALQKQVKKMAKKLK